MQNYKWISTPKAQMVTTFHIWREGGIEMVSLGADLYYILYISFVRIRDLIL